MHNTDNVPEPGGENSNATTNNNNNSHSNNNNNITNNNNNNLNTTTQRTIAATMGHSTVTPLTNNGGGVTSAVSAAPNTIGASGGCTRECAGCGKRIIERFLLKALDLFWHEDCLKCGCCDCRLGEVGSTLYTKANLILCKRDYLRLFGTTGYCAACNKVIPAFEMVMRAKSNVYHLECFACQQCNHSVTLSSQLEDGRRKNLLLMVCEFTGYSNQIRFCVGDRFYLCDNKILCEYDYEERLVFANMAYNPSSLAHIRRQVSNLQPAGDNMNCGIGSGRMSSTSTSSSSTVTVPLTTQRPLQCFNDNKLPNLPQAPSNMGPHRDDGSSGYGSPDSETFESPQAQ